MTKRTNVWTDAMMLRALQLVDCHNATARGAARVISHEFGVSLTKNAIIGMLHRINREANAVPCQCTKPENRDYWWRR